MSQINTLKTTIDLVNLILKTRDTFKNDDLKLIEELMIDFQSNNLLKASNKTQHAFVNSKLQFNKLHYLEKSLEAHAQIISKALKKSSSNSVTDILQGLVEINSETLDEIQAFNISDEKLKPYINQEYPPLRFIIDKYRYVLCRCCINLCEPFEEKLTKVNLNQIKKLASILEASVDKV